MNEKRRFVELLKPIRRQAFFEMLAKEGQLFLLFVSTVFLFWMIIPRFIIIAHVYRYLLMTIFVTFIYTLYRLWKTKPTVKTAVQIMNDYVHDDRVLSAYSFLNKEGSIEQLLIKDANFFIEANQEAALRRKKQWLYPKMLFVTIFCLLLSFLSLYFPNDVMKAGIEKGKEEKIVKEFKKELKKDLAKDKKAEEKKAYEELNKKIDEAKTADKIMEEIAKQLKEAELKELKEKTKQEQLKEWQNRLQEAGLNDLAKALDSKDMDEINQLLEDLLKDFQQLSANQKLALTSLLNTPSLSEENLAGLQEAINELLDSDKNAEMLDDLQKELVAKGEELSKKLSENGLPPSSIALSPNKKGTSNQQTAQNPNSANNNNQNGNNQGNTNPNGNNNQGQGSGSGQNQGQGSGTGQGQGSGSGQGQGNGSGQGQGQGSGTGQGFGSGQGPGAGFGTGSREFLTIPEYTAGGINIENDFGPIGDGKKGEQYTSSGPVTKGKIRHYEEVYSDYEKATRESIERVNLPTDLEEIIKNYFSTVKP